MWWYRFNVRRRRGLGSRTRCLVVFAGCRGDGRVDRLPFSCLQIVCLTSDLDGTCYNKGTAHYHQLSHISVPKHYIRQAYQ